MVNFVQSSLLKLSHVRVELLARSSVTQCTIKVDQGLVSRRSSTPLLLSRVHVVLDAGGRDHGRVSVASSFI